MLSPGLQYRGVHVRPGYQERYAQQPERYRGRTITFFDSIEQAFNYSDGEPEETEEGDDRIPLVFIHAGTFKPEYLIIDSNIILIGAGMHWTLSTGCKL